MVRGAMNSAPCATTAGHAERTSFACTLVIAFLLSLFAICALPVQAHAEVLKADIVGGATVGERGLSVAECPSIDAEFAVLMDSDGNVLFSRLGDDESQIASLTKVMTAIVAIDNAPADLHISVSEAAALIGESSAGLQEGDVMDFETALKALLVPSGNDIFLKAPHINRMMPR